MPLFGTGLIDLELDYRADLVDLHFSIGLPSQASVDHRSAGHGLGNHPFKLGNLDAVKTWRIGHESGWRGMQIDWIICNAERHSLE